jgi:hypothetical protein
MALLLQQGLHVFGLPERQAALAGGYGQLQRLAQVRNLLVIYQ